MTFLKVRWSMSAFRASEFAVLGKTVVCYSREGIRCLNAISGEMLWEDFEDRADGLAYAGAARLFVARRPATSVLMDRASQMALDEVDLVTGVLLRRIPSDLSPVSHHAHGLLCRAIDGFGGTRTSVALIDEVSGAAHWREEGLDADAFQWDILVAEPLVFVARGMAVEGRRLADGALVWRTDLSDLGGALWPWRPAVGDGVLICAAERGTAALEATTGRPLWSVSVRTRATVHGGKAYLLDRRSKLGVYVAQTGELLVSHDLAKSASPARRGLSSSFCLAALVRDGAIILGDDAGWLWMFAVDSGEVLERLQPRRGGWIAGGALLSHNSLFVSVMGLEDSPATIYCIG